MRTMRRTLDGMPRGAPSPLHENNPAGKSAKHSKGNVAKVSEDLARKGTDRMNLEKFRECPICGNKNPDEAAVISEVIDIYRLWCQKCNCAYFSEEVTPSQKYDLEYNLHFYRPGDVAQAVWLSELVRDFCKGNIPAPRILEVGVGNALTMLLLRLRGLPSEGVDIDPVLCEYFGRLYNLTIYPGGIENLDKKMEYDLVYSSHVIEHFANPRLFLKKIRAMLDIPGYLIIYTPDLDLSNERNPNWRHFKTRHPFEHACILSRTSLGYLAAKEGYFLHRFERYAPFGSFLAILSRS